MDTNDWALNRFNFFAIPIAIAYRVVYLLR